LSEQLIAILEQAKRINIIDHGEGFTDGQGRYWGRYLLEVAPYGENEKRFYGDDLVVLIGQASAAVPEP
jgi:hypothetical protein